MAVVSDVQKQKIGMGMTLATQQHLLASSGRAAVAECMNAQSLKISQTEEVRERREMHLLCGARRLLHAGVQPEPSRL